MTCDRSKLLEKIANTSQFKNTNYKIQTIRLNWVHIRSHPVNSKETNQKQEKVKMSKVPMVAGTMQTDPRSGGVKRSSGVNVLPAVAEGQWVEHAKPLLSCFFNLLLSLMISMWAHHQKLLSLYPQHLSLGSNSR